LVEVDKADALKPVREMFPEWKVKFEFNFDGNLDGSADQPVCIHSDRTVF
jgi:hypothetical protein